MSSLRISNLIKRQRFEASQYPPEIPLPGGQLHRPGHDRLGLRLRRGGGTDQVAVGALRRFCQTRPPHGSPYQVCLSGPRRGPVWDHQGLAENPADPRGGQPDPGGRHHLRPLRSGGGPGPGALPAGRQRHGFLCFYADFLRIFLPVLPQV